MSTQNQKDTPRFTPLTAEQQAASEALGKFLTPESQAYTHQQLEKLFQKSKACGASKHEPAPSKQPPPQTTFETPVN